MEDIISLEQELIRWRQALIKYLPTEWAEGLRQDIEKIDAIMRNSSSNFIEMTLQLLEITTCKKIVMFPCSHHVIIIHLVKQELANSIHNNS